MNEFKLDDRVAAYSVGVKNRGTVESILGELLEIKLRSGKTLFYHKKQCRKLKPKEKIITITCTASLEFGCINCDGMIKYSQTSGHYVPKRFGFTHEGSYTQSCSKCRYNYSIGERFRVCEL